VISHTRISDACGIFGVINESAAPIPGTEVTTAMEAMSPRYNGLGAGFAGYGLYPKYKDYYALHMAFYRKETKLAIEKSLKAKVEIAHEEPIPTRRTRKIREKPILWRYFVKPLPNRTSPKQNQTQDDQIVELVAWVNSRFEDAFIFSSGKNMGVFKAVGYPWDVARFYRIDEYEAYMWLGHGRYPTNTPGWWGGAHPFNILSWSIVHNGEISSYGTNRRYIEQFGYQCTCQTDSEVLAYLFDLLVRRHELPIEVACTAISPPFWKRIDKLGAEERKLYQAIRITYQDALVNGPFSTIVATTHDTPCLIGFTDRIKLRPLVAAREGDRTYIASEECAIKAICPEPEAVWALEARIPLVARVRSGMA